MIEPTKEVAKVKPAGKAKQPAKRKKHVAAKPEPSKIIHLKKRTLGQRIKWFFRLGSKPADD